ncbi:HVO_A0114 family putative DNA-binding protein [Halococcus hamelinensis]|uniref:Uncharacterized protein n=1 Tax=Halococcus hamelinensis 100A6 TaxID=1132509 RepID=M0M8G7_9EURY|nr:hypothetical protein [Halococcus hamelinensis]EMA42011.1 hypothetical protein C447_00435 [Halococcus hamelinensis 100A6]
MDESSDSADDQPASESTGKSTLLEKGASAIDQQYAEAEMDEESHAILRTHLFSTALNAAGYERPMVLSWEDARDVMTEKRLEILDALGSDVEIESQRALARHLDRNYSDVSDDLDILYEVGVIEREHPDRNTIKPVLATENIAVNPILVNGTHLSAEANVTTFDDDEEEANPEDIEAEAEV